MKQRGRKSVSSLSVVPDGALRPAPPPELTASEREMWLRVVNEKPVAWFDAASSPLLVEYCRLKTQIDLLTLCLADFTPELLREPSAAARHRGFMQARDRSQKTMAMLATKMRLAQQSRYDEKVASRKVGATTAPVKMPWERAS